MRTTLFLVFKIIVLRQFFHQSNAINDRFHTLSHQFGADNAANATKRGFSQLKPGMLGWRMWYNNAPIFDDLHK